MIVTLGLFSTYKEQHPSLKYCTTALLLCPLVLNVAAAVVLRWGMRWGFNLRCWSCLYEGGAEECPWLVWVSQTGAFPFREDLRLQARERQATQYIRYCYCLMKSPFWFLQFLGHLAGHGVGSVPWPLVRSSFWLQSISLLKSLLSHPFFLGGDHCLGGYVRWLLLYLLMGDCLLLRRSPVVIHKATGSAIPVGDTEFGRGCCLGTSTVTAYFLGLWT